MINRFSDLNITTPANMLNRLQDSKSAENIEFSITVYDASGSSFNGLFEQISSDTLLISDKSGSTIFFDVNHLTHLVLHDPQLHLRFLQYSAPTKKIKNDSYIDLTERIQLLQQMLEKNYSLAFSFSIDNCNKEIEAERVAILLDFLSANIKELAYDEFNLTALKKVSSFHIANTQKTKFSLKFNKEAITIYINFKEELPKNINDLIEKGFNRVL